MKNYSVSEVANYTGIPESTLNTLIVCDVLEITQSPEGEIFITQEQFDKFLGGEEMNKEKLYKEIEMIKNEMINVSSSKQNLKYMHYMILGMIKLAFKLKIIDMDERLELEQGNREYLDLLCEVAV